MQTLESIRFDCLPSGIGGFYNVSPGLGTVWQPTRLTNRSSNVSKLVLNQCGIKKGPLSEVLSCSRDLESLTIWLRRPPEEESLNFQYVVDILLSKHRLA